MVVIDERRIGLAYRSRRVPMTSSYLLTSKTASDKGRRRSSSTAAATATSVVHMQCVGRGRITQALRSHGEIDLTITVRTGRLSRGRPTGCTRNTAQSEKSTTHGRVGIAGRVRGFDPPPIVFNPHIAYCSSTVMTLAVHC